MKTNCFLPTICSFLFFLFVSCSFDYGDASSSEKDQPDIVMENVEYVRVRSAELQARFQAELAERYEERRLMQLKNFSLKFVQDGPIAESDPVDQLSPEAHPLARGADSRLGLGAGSQA